MRINDNFEKLPVSYLFSTVARNIREYRETHPEADVIRMDIGDVTRPIPQACIQAMHRAIDDMTSSSTFHGYGPEQGYDFLRQAIADGDYHSIGVDINPDDIFISDGAKSDLGNLSDIYSADSIVAVADPGYPVYVDSNVIAGRGGEFVDGKWSRMVYLPCTPDNGFSPEPPTAHADVIFLCSPSNPTGALMSRELLKRWVGYALANKSLIIFDSAYCAYVRSEDAIRSIYQIPGADKVAIEVRSFSKTAGFTGLRCGYTVVPAALKGMDASGAPVALRNLWLRRQTTKFNGASYIIQRGAEAIYTPEGKAQVRENVDYYLRNTALIRRSLADAGFSVFGGCDSPYVWARPPFDGDSWQMFRYLLEQAQISTTPGSGFGSQGEGWLRFTGFNSYDNTVEAMKRVARISELKQ